MGEGIERAIAAARRTNLTPRQAQILSVLTEDFESPDTIARRAMIFTSSPRETAANFCRQLVKLELAEKGGTSMFPRWRKLSKNEGF